MKRTIKELKSIIAKSETIVKEITEKYLSAKKENIPDESACALLIDLHACTIANALHCKYLAEVITIEKTTASIRDWVIATDRLLVCIAEINGIAFDFEERLSSLVKEVIPKPIFELDFDGSKKDNKNEPN